MACPVFSNHPFLTLPGLSSYPPVKIADRNAKQTAIIRIRVMENTSRYVSCSLFIIPQFLMNWYSGPVNL